jgi:type VI secretion system protein ImpE
MQAQELLRQGRLDECLAELTAAVKKSPADARQRVFLFQLLCVLGQWDRAMTQLNVAAEMDAANLLMAQVCRPALNCEALRAEIFAGRRAPLVLGEPEEWLGWLIQANALVADGKAAPAAALRDKALEAAPAVAGTINGHAFGWIADADSRLGPTLEAVVDGRYYWAPFSRISRLRIEPPSDLRDVVWLPANIIWTNGGEAVALLPVRYPGSERSTDSGIRLARRTEWTEPHPGTFIGLGQRLLATDQGEYPLLEVREIALGETGGATGSPRDG